MTTLEPPTPSTCSSLELFEDTQTLDRTQSLHSVQTSATTPPGLFSEGDILLSKKRRREQRDCSGMMESNNWIREGVWKGHRDHKGDTPRSCVKVEVEDTQPASPLQPNKKRRRRDEELPPFPQQTISRPLAQPIRKKRRRNVKSPRERPPPAAGPSGTPSSIE